MFSRLLPCFLYKDIKFIVIKKLVILIVHNIALFAETLKMLKTILTLPWLLVS